MKQTQQETIADLVQKDYRTADVLKKYGINFCCRSQQSLEVICREKNLQTADILNEIEQATRTVYLPNSISYYDWPINFLVDYLIHVHHNYWKQMLPLLKSLVHELAERHQKKYPELPAVQENVAEITSMLYQHMRIVEEDLFPYVKQINSLYIRKEPFAGLFIRTLKPLDIELQKNLSLISSCLMQLRQLTQQYQLPDDACTKHQVVYQKLKELDSDLIQYNFLENVILFPKALAMEQELLQQ